MDVLSGICKQLMIRNDLRGDPIRLCHGRDESIDLYGFVDHSRCTKYFCALRNLCVGGLRILVEEDVWV